MRIILHIIGLSLLLICRQQVSGQTDWKLGTAATLERNNLVVGQVQPTRYGVTDNLEVSSQVESFLLVPNVSVKYRWYAYKNEMAMASRHTVYYPVPGMKAGRFLPFLPTFPGDVHQTLGTRNELLLTDYFKTCSCCLNSYSITYKMGLQKGFPADNNSMALIQEPFWLLRMQMLRGHYLWNLGMDVDGHLAPRWRFSFELDYYRIFGPGNQSIEQEGVVIYHLRRDVHVYAGYRLGWNPNIAAKPFQLIPLYDISFRWFFRQPPRDGFEWNH